MKTTVMKQWSFLISKNFKGCLCIDKSLIGIYDIFIECPLDDVIEKLYTRYYIKLKWQEIA